MSHEAKQGILVSRRENRTVTLYPDTRKEYQAIMDDLLAEGDDSAEVSGAGFCGSEERGYTEVWGDGWRVDVVLPPS